MPALTRLKHKTLARLAAIFPFLGRKLAAGYDPPTNRDIPWTPVKRPLAESKIALVTTAGIHHPDQQPFDMADPRGDPQPRRLNSATIVTAYTITHDYYDHRDADKDLNVVLPLARLAEMQRAGLIGAVADHHYSFMGHITGPHIDTLVRDQAPAIAARLLAERVDVVVLTPG